MISRDQFPLHQIFLLAPAGKGHSLLAPGIPTFFLPFSFYSLSAFPFQMPRIIYCPSWVVVVDGIYQRIVPVSIDVVANLSQPFKPLKWYWRLFMDHTVPSVHSLGATTRAALVPAEI
jgi:hypothetical protein